jgi:hypothetical protein
MSMQGAGRSRLDETRRRLARWRAEHGGRGRPILDELWAAAVAVARVEGVEATARTLRVDRYGLGRRMHESGSDSAREGHRDGSNGFVELSAGALSVPGRTILRLQGRDGESVQVECSGACPLDVDALARAFWRRPR